MFFRILSNLVGTFGLFRPVKGKKGHFWAKNVDTAFVREFQTLRSGGLGQKWGKVSQDRSTKIWSSDPLDPEGVEFGKQRLQK